MALGGSYTDYSGPGWNSLQTALGISGSNPARPLARRLNVAQGIGALQQQAFSNYLQPQRESAIMRLIQNLSPGNKQKQVDAFARGAQSRAADTAANTVNALQGFGYGTGAQSGAVGSIFEGAAGDVNNYDAQINSPQGEMASLQAIIQAIASARDPELAAQFLQAMGMIQQSNLMKSAPNDIWSNLAGTVGNLAGMGTFDNLFGGGGGGQWSNSGTVSGTVG